MRIDENTTLKQVIQMLGVQGRPWLINPVPQSDLAFIEDLAEREKLLQFMNGRTFSELSLKEILHFCPGGGYVNVCSITEGFPLAAALKQKGIASFILHYR